MKQLACRYETDIDPRQPRLKPGRDPSHARLLAGRVAEHEQPLPLTQPGRIACVLAGLPLADLAGDDDIDLWLREHTDLRAPARTAGQDRHALARHVEIADNAQRFDTQPCLDPIGELAQRHRRNAAEVELLRQRAGDPFQLIQQAGDGRIRLQGVQQVVEAPDDDALLLDEAAFRLVDRFVRQPVGLVAVIVEDRLVGDDQIRAELAACSITSTVARKVVTIPVSGCAGSPILTVSTVSAAGRPVPRR